MYGTNESFESFDDIIVVVSPSSFVFCFVKCLPIHASWRGRRLGPVTVISLFESPFKFVTSREEKYCEGKNRHSAAKSLNIKERVERTQRMTRAFRYRAVNTIIITIIATIIITIATIIAISY